MMRVPSDLLLLGRARATLGEGIRYDEETDSLLWLDIPESRAWRVDHRGEEEEPLSLGDEAAFACPIADGRILAGGDGGFWLDGRRVGGGDWVGASEILNDGAVHPSGNFLVFGSRDRSEEDPLGHMWLLGKTLERMPWSFTVFNGPAFDPGGERIYFADSSERTIFAARIDPGLGRIRDRTVFARVPESLGYPDGMTCDSEGGLWSAHWDGGCVTRYLPDGSVDFRVAMPTRRPTSLAFRGRRLAVTSARCAGPGEADPADWEGRAFSFDAARAGPPSPRLGETPLRTLMSLS